VRKHIHKLVKILTSSLNIITSGFRPPYWILDFLDVGHCRRNIGFLWCRALLYDIADVFAGIAVLAKDIMSELTTKIHKSDCIQGGPKSDPWVDSRVPLKKSVIH